MATAVARKSGAGKRSSRNQVVPAPDTELPTLRGSVGQWARGCGFDCWGVQVLHKAAAATRPPYGYGYGRRHTPMPL